MTDSSTSPAAIFRQYAETVINADGTADIRPAYSELVKLLNAGRTDPQLSQELIGVVNGLGFTNSKEFETAVMKGLSLSESAKLSAFAEEILRGDRFSLGNEQGTTAVETFLRKLDQLNNALRNKGGAESLELQAFIPGAQSNEDALNRLTAAENQSRFNMAVQITSGSALGNFEAGLNAVSEAISVAESGGRSADELRQSLPADQQPLFWLAQQALKARAKQNVMQGRDSNSSSETAPTL